MNQETEESKEIAFELITLRRQYKELKRRYEKQNNELILSKLEIAKLKGSIKEEETKEEEIEILML